jgi:hypothetical protein
MFMVPPSVTIFQFNKENPEAARLGTVLFADLLQAVSKNGLNRQPGRPM